MVGVALPMGKVGSKAGGGVRASGGEAPLGWAASPPAGGTSYPTPDAPSDCSTTAGAGGSCCVGSTTACEGEGRLASSCGLELSELEVEVCGMASTKFAASSAVDGASV